MSQVDWIFSRNTIKLSTPQTTSKMQTSQSNDSTSDTQESLEWVGLVPIKTKDPISGWDDSKEFK